MDTGLDHYGVWKLGHGFTWELGDARENNKPHIEVHWEDTDGRSCNAAINVASSDSVTSRLVHWENTNFPKNHPIVQALRNLTAEDGYRECPPGSALRLDFLRGGVITDITSGTIWVQTQEGPNNDLVDQLVAILSSAVDRRATLYIFGEPYAEGNGIHQVHQNQGNFYIPDEGAALERNSRKWFYENGVGQDGGLFFYFPDTDTWTTVFLAFASQTVKTDDGNGQPIEVFGGEEVLNYQDTIAPGSRPTTRTLYIPPSRDHGGKVPDAAWPKQQALEAGTVRLAAALINPLSQQDEDEMIRIANEGTITISLKGWWLTLQRTNKRKQLPNVVVPPGDSVEVLTRPGAELANTSGDTIVLRNSNRLVVDYLKYVPTDVHVGEWFENLEH